MFPRLCSLAGLALLTPATWAGDDPPCPDAQLLTCPASYYATHQPIELIDDEGGNFGCRIVRPDQRAVVMCTPVDEDPHDGFQLTCGEVDGTGFSCTSWPHGPDLGTAWQLQGHQSVAVEGSQGRIYVMCHPGVLSDVSVKAQTSLPNGVFHIESLTVACDASKGESTEIPEYYPIPVSPTPPVNPP